MQDTFVRIQKLTLMKQNRTSFSNCGLDSESQKAETGMADSFWKDRGDDVIEKPHPFQMSPKRPQTPETDTVDGHNIIQRKVFLKSLTKP